MKIDDRIVSASEHMADTFATALNLVIIHFLWHALLLILPSLTAYFGLPLVQLKSARLSVPSNHRGGWVLMEHHAVSQGVIPIFTHLLNYIFNIS
jgi:hypothetical protein